MLLFLLCYLPIFPTSHAISIAEEACKRHTAGNTRQFAYQTNGVVGGLQQAGYIFQSVAGDEIQHRITMRTLMDGLSDVLGIGTQQLGQYVAVQILVGVELLFCHQRADTAVKQLVARKAFFWLLLQLSMLFGSSLFALLNLFVESSVFFCQQLVVSADTPDDINCHQQEQHGGDEHEAVHGQRLALPGYLVFLLLDFFQLLADVAALSAIS